MGRFATSSVLALCLGALSACGGTAGKDAEQLDASLLGKGNTSDPALTAALEDQIMVDPALTGQSNANAIRPSDEPMQAPVPSEKDVDPSLAGNGKTLGQLAAQQAQISKDNFNGCGLDVDYSMVWSTRLPSGLPLYPQSRVVEAAGSDTNGCKLRAVTFTSTAAPRTLIDYYLDAAKRAGYAAEHSAQGTENLVSGTRNDGAAFYVILSARPNGGVSADLVTNQGI